MRRINGPFQRSANLGIPILQLLESDPAAGNSKLAELVEVTRLELEAASGPVLYVLSGPEPGKATPMQYGGFFLERDRELLELAKQMGEVWLLIDAGEGAYLDFVSDLPADVFCWDAKEAGFSLSEMRKLRNGRLCTNEPGSDEDFSMLEDSREAEAVAR